MLIKEQAQSIFERLRKLSQAEELEVLLGGGRSALTRFANNTIHQNVAEENSWVSVRAVFGGRTARATTNKFDDESLRRVVKSAEELSKVQHPDADLLPMATGSEPTATASRHFAETAAIGPRERASAVAKIVDIAKREQLTAAGIFSTAESVEAIFNSKDWRAITPRPRLRFP